MDKEEDERRGEWKKTLSLSHKHWCFHGDHYGMPNWLLGEEEEDVEEVGAGGFIPVSPRWLERVGGLALSQGAVMSGGADVLLFAAFMQQQLSERNVRNAVGG